MGNCSESIGTICSKKVNLKCTKYTGIVSEKSTLDPNTCHTGYSTLEDIYTQLNSLFNNLNLSTLGDKCLIYDGANTEEYLKNVLLKFEDEICNIKELLSKRALDLTDLDTKCLKDACDNSPIELLEVLQLIIDRLCSTTPTDNSCECCPKNVMHNINEGTPPSFGISDAIVEFITDYVSITGNPALEYIATEKGRYKVRWTGEFHLNTANENITTFNYPAAIFFRAYKGTGTQVNNPSNSTYISHAGSRFYNPRYYDVSSQLYKEFSNQGFEFEFDINLNIGESVAVSVQENDNEHYIGNNLFTVDKACDPKTNN